MSAINGLPAAFTEIIRLQAEISKLNAALTESQRECEYKESEFWRIQRICAETSGRCDREIHEMRKVCETMRVEKLQIERGLAMLGTDDPTNIILRLNKELEEVKAQLASKTSLASMLEASLACCDKERVAELEKLLHEGREQAQAEVYELRREHEEEVDAFRGEIYDLERQLEDARSAVADSSAQLRKLQDKLFAAEEEVMATRGKLDLEAQECVRLNREVAEYADTVDHLQRQLRAAAGWSGSPTIDNAADEIARKEQVILRLTRERDIWRNRHAAVTQSAQRLRDELDEVYAAATEPSKTARPPLNPDAAPFFPSRPLNPAAPEFVPAAQSLKAAVQKRLAEKAAEAEAARKATVESFKSAILARLVAAEKPTLTVTEVSVPNHETDPLKYKEYCVSKIQSMLSECAAAVGPSNKAAVAVRLFTFIKEHGMPFLRTYKKFRLTVVAKCWEFKGEEKSTAELIALSDWILEQFKDDIPRLSYGCGNCVECFKALVTHTMNAARTFTNVPAPAPVIPQNTVAAVRLTTPIQRIPAPNITPTKRPAAPTGGAPAKLYRTRTRTGVIPRRSYAEESDSE